MSEGYRRLFGRFVKNGLTVKEQAKQSPKRRQKQFDNEAIKGEQLSTKVHGGVAASFKHWVNKTNIYQHACHSILQV